MLLTTNTVPLSSRYGDEKAIEMLAAAGFDGIDYSVTNLENFPSAFSEDHIEYAKKLRKLADEKGIRFTQAHAPMPYSANKDEYIKLRTEQAIMALEMAPILGAEIVVVHPISHGGRCCDKRMEFYQMNMDFYRTLLPHAERLNVKIACENIFQGSEKGIVDGLCSAPEEFAKYIDDIGSPYLVACVDLGHVAVTGRKAEDMLRAMGGRVSALHIHDNDGVTDLHKLPGTVSMDWNEICKAIAEIDYKGNFNFEPDGFINAYDDAFMPTALKFLHDTGRYFISVIENLK